jgi:hypothetical protein
MIKRHGPGQAHDRRRYCLSPPHDLYVAEATPSLEQVRDGSSLQPGEVTVAIKSSGICGFVYPRESSTLADAHHDRRSDVHLEACLLCFVGRHVSSLPLTRCLI